MFVVTKDGVIATDPVAYGRPQGGQHYVDEIKGYRALFDVRPPDDSNDIIDVRLYLRIDSRPLTETWIYQWMPPSVKERKAALGTV